MTYIVFGGTLGLTQSINQSISLLEARMHTVLAFLSVWSASVTVSLSTISVSVRLSSVDPHMLVTNKIQVQI